MLNVIAVTQPLSPPLSIKSEKIGLFSKKSEKNPMIALSNH